MMLLQKPMLGTQLDRSDSLNNPVLDLLMNEGHGNIVHDLSGWGNHGTLHGFDFPPTRTSGWNPGLDGVGLNFDGTDDYINCGNNPILNPTGAFTVDTLIKTTNTAHYVIVNKRNASVKPPGFWELWYYSGNGLRFEIANDVVSSAAQYGGVINDGNLHRIIGTYSDPVITLYVDGIQRATGNLAGMTPNTENVYIGSRISNDEHYFKGLIARARILSRAMSPFEVMQRQIDPYGVYLR